MFLSPGKFQLGSHRPLSLTQNRIITIASRRRHVDPILFSSIRLSSTSSPPKDTHTRTPAHHDPPLFAHKQKQKHKLDLTPRPAPPTLASSVLGPNPLVTPTCTKPASARGERKEQECESERRRREIFAAMAAHDIRTPPLGLTKVQTLWFTFKEYAVSSCCFLPAFYDDELLR